MKLPLRLHQEVEGRFGPIREVTAIGGGCVSSACRVEAGGRLLFVKYEPDAPADFFAVEAAGLAELRGAMAAVRVPEVLACVDGPGEMSWIALEWLDAVAASEAFGAPLGVALSEIHRVAGRGWGWHRDGFIGPLPQSNRVRGGWADFWWKERLSPQLTRAQRAGHCRESGWDELATSLPDLLAPAETEGPSLLHGDLWGGNVVTTREGAALVDPACYWGHREVDLAMSELFGGFGPNFYAAYASAWPLMPGYSVRRGVYQLYYLLVHVNLFGAGYMGRTTATLRSVLAAG